MSQRTLIEIRRQVPGSRSREYDEVWGRLEEAVVGGGSHAWRFRSRDDPLLFVEFLEFATGRDPRLDPGIRRRISELDALAPGSIDEWVSVPAKEEEESEP